MASAPSLPDAWKKLQNGSDIRGVAIGSASEAPNLTPHVATLIAAAFVRWLAAKLGKDAPSLRVSVGHDSRISAADMKAAAAQGIFAEGAEAHDFGLASTPAMFMSTVTPGFEYDGAIMLTASHLPFNRNGLKFFTKAGGLEKGDITKILQIAAQLEKERDQQATPLGKTMATVDFMSTYAQILVERIRKGVAAPNHDEPLKGFKIIVDAGNGAGGFFVDKVLRPLGADTEGSQFLEPDGHFPNHIPNPEDKTAMASIREATLRTKADLGIIFDTDVDRAAVVDPAGNEINRDRLIALISAIVLEEHPGSTIVTDSVTSNGLAHYIEALGGRHHRFKRGYKNVIDEGVRLNKQGTECHLAIETSGHGAMRENHFLDDGAYLVVKILIKMAKMKPTTISTLIESLPEPKEDLEVRLALPPASFGEYGAKVLGELEAFVAQAPGWEKVPNNFEGVRVSTGSGWFLLRLSLHDPVLPLNLQSDEEGGVRAMLSTLLPFFQGFDQLGLDAVVKALQA